MDRYKHDVSTQRSKRLTCAPKPKEAENSDDVIKKPITNGAGILDLSTLYYPSDIIFFLSWIEQLLHFVFQMQSIITTTTLFLMGPVRLYFFTLLVWTRSSASRMTTGNLHRGSSSRCNNRRNSCIMLVYVVEVIMAAFVYLCNWRLFYRRVTFYVCHLIIFKRICQTAVCAVTQPW